MYIKYYVHYKSVKREFLLKLISEVVLYYDILFSVEASTQFFDLVFYIGWSPKERKRTFSGLILF